MFHRMMNYGEMEVRPTVILTKDMIKKSLPKFKRHEDLIVVQESAWEDFKKSLPLPVVHDENSPFSIDEDELASLVCQTVQKPTCRRLAVEREVKNHDYQSPNVDLILGDHGIVEHKENQILYRFDITKCRFSFGIIEEKMRMGELDCSGEIVVDLIAGIGYFSLPLLVHSKAKHLYACERNPEAIEALKKNLAINKVEPNRYTVIEGDTRINRPTDVAQRVLLGTLPSCIDWMQAAFECIDKSTGAIIHCHELIEHKPQGREKQISINSLETSTTDRLQLTQSFNQSISSSSSSHSTIEKLMASDEKNISSESDKDTCSLVLVEKPSGSSTNVSISPTEITSEINETSSISSNHDGSISEKPNITEHEMSIFETRGQMLIAQIKDEVESHDFKAQLINIQPVKSYSSFVSHIVFDIRIEPKTMVI